MNRLPPTEPPEEPVNRIAPYLDKVEDGSALKTFGPPLKLTPELLDKFKQELEKARAEYESDPEALPRVKNFILQFYQSGEYLQVIMFAEWFQAVSQISDPEIEAMLAEARRRVAEEGNA